MVGGEEEDDIGAEQNIGKQQSNPAQSSSLYSTYNLLGHTGPHSPISSNKSWKLANSEIDNF